MMGSQYRELILEPRIYRYTYQGQLVRYMTVRVYSGHYVAFLEHVCVSAEAAFQQKSCVFLF